MSGKSHIKLVKAMRKQNDEVRDIRTLYWMWWETRKNQKLLIFFLSSLRRWQKNWLKKRRRSYLDKRQNEIVEILSRDEGVKNSGEDLSCQWKFENLTIISLKMTWMNLLKITQIVIELIQTTHIQEGKKVKCRAIKIHSPEMIYWVIY